jgi:hypothetical protein
MSTTTQAAALVSRSQLDQFIGAVFRHADDGTFVSLRTFDQHDRSRPPLAIKGIRVGDPRLLDEAEKSARHAATASAPCVFAPPAATFTNAQRARRADLTNGLVLALELDQGDTQAALDKIAGIIGPATLVVRSGGTWADPDTGELHPKLHAYWRLSEPTTDQAGHDLLAVARHHAALLTGADLTGAAPVHCFRWPGSVHTKDPLHPTPCTIERRDEDAEVDLIEAAERLAEAVEQHGLTRGNGADHGQATRGPLPSLQRVAEVLALVPNDDESYSSPEASYNFWLVIGYATYGSTDGSDAGLDAFNTWSAKNSKHDPKENAALWGRIHKAGHVRSGFGSIKRAAERAIIDFPRPSAGAAPGTGNGSGPGPQPQPQPPPPPLSRAPQPGVGPGRPGSQPPQGGPKLPDGILQPDVVLDVLNRRYALMHEGGNAVIWEEKYDPILKRLYYDRISIGAFKALYNNRLVVVGQNDDGTPKLKPAGDFWLKHPDRKDYLGGIVFRPEQQVPHDTFNLWRDFGVTPQPGGSWNLLHTHIFEAVCRNDQELSDYLLDWMAFAAQHPDAQCEVIIIIRGEEGAGKSILGRVLCHLFGQHGLPIGSPDLLFGRFNLHLRDCVLLLADEVFGDKATEGKLKSLTDATRMIEGKNMHPYLAPNFMRIIITSNRDWVVPTGLRPRRYLLLDADDRYVGNHAYFAAIQAELEANDGTGYAAMLHDLRARDISNFNHRAAPKTKGLQDQIERSLKTEEAWMKEVLHRGYILRSTIGLDNYFFQWHEIMAAELVYASYCVYVKGHHDRQPLSRELLGKSLIKWGVKHCQPRNLVVGEEWAEVTNPQSNRSERKPVLIQKPRGEAYRFGSLAHARRDFAKATKLTIDWTGRGK